MSLRYAILRHDGVDEPHFDLMFETAPGSALATWRSQVWPIFEPAPLQRLRDHRRQFLDFEGTLSGERGSVMRVERNTFEFLTQNADVLEMAMESDHGRWKLRLDRNEIEGEGCWTARRT